MRPTPSLGVFKTFIHHHVANRRDVTFPRSSLTGIVSNFFLANAGARKSFFPNSLHLPLNTSGCSHLCLPVWIGGLVLCHLPLQSSHSPSSSLFSFFPTAFAACFISATLYVYGRIEFIDRAAQGQVGHT